MQDRLVLRDGRLYDKGVLVSINPGAGSARLLEDRPIDSSSVVVHASRVLDLDFSRGLAMAKEVKNLFKTSVHPNGIGEFLMVVSFGRAAFRLDEDTVSLALESVIVGYCGQLQV